jgi:UDP:flavonoid glycosyltransferase YjiC (YdhE family)
MKKQNVTAVVSTGGRFDSYKSKNIIIEKYLPGSVIAAKSDLMICTDRTSATYQELSEGSPIPAIPCNPDQYYSSTALELNKVGILIRSNMVGKKIY